MEALRNWCVVSVVTHQLISKEQAAAPGLRRYFTGIACMHGHVSERYVNGGQCVDCGRMDAARRRSVVTTGPIQLPPTMAQRKVQLGTVYIEPTPWDFDGCKHREAVRDEDRNPPVTIRFGGWNLCLRCLRPFFSHDVKFIRLCGPCKAAA